MPLTRIGETGGNVSVKDGIATVVEPGTAPFVAHFVDCPQAKRWRKR